MICFHEPAKSGPYFEGWYFKCQAPDGQVLSLIPAVHMDKTGKKTFSLQVITENQSWWLENPWKKVSDCRESGCLCCDGDRFCETGLDLDICKDTLRLQGNIRFFDQRPLKTHIMGPFRFFRNMECVPDVISVSHKLSGTILLNGKQICLDGGRGYIESDRGRSFPTAYLWIQDLWDSGSFMLSVASIPFAARIFTGCICAVCIKDKEYRIATYRGARIESWSAEYVSIRQGRFHLEVTITDRRAMPLKAPVFGNMTRTVNECLTAAAHIRLRRGDQILLDRVTDRASYEYSDENAKA